MTRPWNLDYWKSGEWQVVDERLRDMERAGVRYNPIRANLFRSLASVSPSDCRVCLIGQDPYPAQRHATGLAFSVPRSIPVHDIPRTGREILAEYKRDLGYPVPSHCDLTRWVEQGVLLWNVIPSCTDGVSLSHDWPEYEPLNREVLGRLSEKGIVFVFFGAVAKRYADYVQGDNNRIILTSHPSPRGSRNSHTPFRGSRIFSTINDNLNSLGLDPIDWRLDDETGSGIRNLQGAAVDGSRVLENITGYDLGRSPRKIAPRVYTWEGDILQ